MNHTVSEQDVLAYLANDPMWQTLVSEGFSEAVKKRYIESVKPKIERSLRRTSPEPEVIVTTTQPTANPTPWYAGLEEEAERNREHERRRNEQEASDTAWCWNVHARRARY